MSRRLEETTDDFEPSAYERANVLICILTGIIMFTVVFEVLKDWLLESASKTMKPIIMQLFGEMTVLGFISILSFLLTYTSALDDLSTDLFGSGGAGYLTEVLEIIHYLLFLVMVLTVMQVMFLVWVGNSAVDVLSKYNMISQDRQAIKSKIVEYVSEVQMHERDFFPWLQSYLSNPVKAWKLNSQSHELTETLCFHALRREFIMNRSSLPPFDIPPKEKWLPDNFDYATYQSKCLSLMLIELVEFTPYTWLGILSIAILFYIFMIIFKDDYVALSCIFLTMGYLDLILLYSIKSSNTGILTKLINPKELKIEEETSTDEQQKPSIGNAGSGTDLNEELRRTSKTSSKDKEKAPLRYQTSRDDDDDDNGGSQSLLPQADTNQSSRGALFHLFHLRADKPLFITTPPDGNTISWASYYFYGTKAVPNRQHQLFVFDLMGPAVNIYILRLHLIFQSLYLALMCVFFTEYINDYAGSPVTLWLVVYILLAFTPLLLQIGFIGTLILDMSHLHTTGFLKSKQIIDEVTRDQKHTKLLSVMNMMVKLRAAKGKTPEEKAKLWARIDRNSPKCQAQTKEITDIFNKYDADKSGDLDKGEVAKMLISLGMAMSETDLNLMFSSIDTDGSGTCSLDEMIDWYLESSSESTTSGQKEDEMKGLARDMFAIYDNDGSGEISLEEFIEGVQKSDAGFTMAEIVSLAKEFDRDGDGNISLVEFEDAIADAMSTLIR